MKVTSDTCVISECPELSSAFAAGHCIDCHFGPHAVDLDHLSIVWADDFVDAVITTLV